MSATYAADAFAGQAVLVTGGAQGMGWRSSAPLPGWARR